MIRLLFVGDGERDAVTVPLFVERLLQTPVKPDTRRWARLRLPGDQGMARVRKGYPRKLLYALRQARDSGASGLVATVDADAKTHKHLSRLREARETDRKEHSKTPIALGEAVRHGEAWLLDDEKAVREALRLPASTTIPSATVSNPKKELHKLLSESPRSNELPVKVWPDIARRVDPKRCRHWKATGFKEFAADVHAELGPLAEQARIGR